MLKVAIVGNIASGKSQVEKILLTLGYKVADTDKLNHYILASDISAINEIKEVFRHDDILDENNNISRSKLGQVVFSEKDKKLQLEGILHKRIFKKVDEFFQENKDEKVVFVSIPLFFEAGNNQGFDKVIFISADEDVRLKRLIARNNYTIEYAKTRISSQGKEEDKIKKSDFVIYNNSDLISLEKQVKNILQKLI